MALIQGVALHQKSNNQKNQVKSRCGFFRLLAQGNRTICDVGTCVIAKTACSFLLEDDKLITGFRITTDRLLEPAASEAEANDVYLVINVEVKATKLTAANMSYFSHF
jgi:hypothetical protein